MTLGKDKDNQAMSSSHTKRMQTHTARCSNTRHSQRSHREAPDIRAKDPGGQRAQAEEPQEPEAEPESQGEHSVEPASLQLPGPHGEHSDDPAVAANDPDWH